jgi:hypothetical protein
MTSPKSIPSGTWIAQIRGGGGICQQWRALREMRRAVQPAIGIGETNCLRRNRLLIENDGSCDGRDDDPRGGQTSDADEDSTYNISTKNALNEKWTVECTDIAQRPGRICHHPHFRSDCSTLIPPMDAGFAHALRRDFVTNENSRAARKAAARRNRMGRMPPQEGERPLENTEKQGAIGERSFRGEARARDHGVAECRFRHILVSAILVARGATSWTLPIVSC